MKHIFLILCLFITTNLLAQNQSKINFLATELHSDYYKEKLYPKDSFKNYVNHDRLLS